MQLNTQQLQIFLIISLVGIGCSDPAPTPNPCILVKETFASASISYENNYTYEGGLLKTANFKSEAQNGVTTFYYGNDVRLDSAIYIPLDSTYKGISVYTYNGNGLLSQIATNGGDTTDFEYNTSGQVVKKIFDRYPSDFTREYTYPNTSTKNSSQVVQTNHGGYQIIYSYTYDEHINPLYGWSVWLENDFFTETPNNIVKIEIISGSISTFEYTYTFDSKGNLLSRTRVGTDEIITFTFSCP